MKELMNKKVEYLERSMNSDKYSKNMLRFFSYRGRHCTIELQHYVRRYNRLQSIKRNR